MPEPISRRVRVNSLSSASGPPIEYVTVSFITLDTPQQWGGSVVVSKADLKKLNITVGDEITLTLAALE